MRSGVIECVPNVSEGRDDRVVEAVAAAVRAVEGVRLLRVESGRDTNRTVYTYMGSPPAVEEATFGLVKRASELIDMRQHRGTHPRIGAVDVVPFIPLDPADTDLCISLSRRLADKIWNELSVPVYLYGKAATSPPRYRLPDIRKGQYEGLEKRMNLPEWKPDFGDIFNPKAGATVVGVRDFMLAYNVNLATADVEKARHIARRIRSSGYREEAPSGEVIRRPGRLEFCQADGWFLPGYGHCQVTMNLHNIPVTGLHDAFEAVKSEAELLGTGVTGSELIGLAPLSALLAAGRFYLQNEGAGEAETLAAAVEHLGLNDSAPFEAEKRIIEYLMGNPG